MPLVRSGRYVARGTLPFLVVPSVGGLVLCLVLAVFLGPVVLVCLVAALPVAIRCLRFGTYVTSNGLTLRDVFSTRKLAWSDIRRFDVGQAEGVRTYRAGFAVLGDGSSQRLPGIGETAFAPNEPDATITRLDEELAAHNA